MASVIHRTTLAFLASVNTPDYPEPEWKHAPDMTAVEGVPSRYWKWDAEADRPVPMTDAERAALGAAAERASFLSVQGASLARLFPDGKTFSHKDAEIWESAVAVLFDVMKGAAEAATLRDVLALIAVRRAAAKGVALG